MELTWVAILASVTMALGAACIFAYAVKRDYFRNIEEAKYHLFWSDLEEPGAPLHQITGSKTLVDGAASPLKENPNVNGGTSQ